MTNIPKVTFSGISGEKYNFEVYAKNVSFNDVSCVYIFTKRVPKPLGGGTHYPLYVGQTGELKTRMSQHHKWDEVNKKGCSHICVHRTDGISESDRLLIERDLILGLNCPCNDC